MLVVGVSPNGHASAISPMLRIASQCLRSSESGCDVTPMMCVTPRWRDNSRISSTSVDLPLVENAIITSSLPTTPRSPCAASAGWMKSAGVAVEHNVAANLRAMCPALPMPVVSTLPRHASRIWIARSKSSSMTIARIASASASITARMRSLTFIANHRALQITDGREARHGVRSAPTLTRPGAVTESRGDSFTRSRSIARDERLSRIAAVAAPRDAQRRAPAADAPTPAAIDWVRVRTLRLERAVDRLTQRMAKVCGGCAPIAIDCGVAAAVFPELDDDESYVLDDRQRRSTVDRAERVGRACARSRRSRNSAASRPTYAARRVDQRRAAFSVARPDGRRRAPFHRRRRHCCARSMRWRSSNSTCCICT